MKYQEEYILKFQTHSIPAIVDEPFELREALCQFTSVDLDRRIAHLIVTVPVETQRLTLGTRPELPALDGEESAPQRGVVVPEAEVATKIARGLSRVLAFARGHTVQVSIHRVELLPETDLDRDFLGSLGTDQPLQVFTAQLSIRTVNLPVLMAQTFARLLDREVGLALYNDAVSLSQPVAQYREYWRVLEAAFGEEGNELVKLLGDFPPAQELGFTMPELNKLLILRGKASHAQSSKGLIEYDRVNSLVEDKVERVRCLAEQVLLTKRTWGRKGLGVERLGRLRSLVRSDGTAVLYTDFDSTLS